MRCVERNKVAGAYSFRSKMRCFESESRNNLGLRRIIYAYLYDDDSVLQENSDTTMILAFTRSG